MSVYKKALKTLLGDVDVTDILIPLIKERSIKKEELRRLAGVLELQIIYNAMDTRTRIPSTLMLPSIS